MSVPVPAILVAPETASQHCRNALAILANAGTLTMDGASETFTLSDVDAIRERLWRAVRELEAK